MPTQTGHSVQTHMRARTHAQKERNGDMRAESEE